MPQYAGSGALGYQSEHVKMPAANPLVEEITTQRFKLSHMGPHSFGKSQVGKPQDGSKQVPS